MDSKMVEGDKNNATKKREKELEPVRWIDGDAGVDLQREM